MTPEELAFAGIARQAELVRSGEVSPRELVELYLDRIERLDPTLNAFRVVMADRALAEADEAAKGGGSDRPLHGVPIAIKDTQDVAGEITTYGTGAFDEPATEDCELVRRLRAAGAIVIGKTNLPELAICGFTESKTWGVTRNPWNTDRTTGGSSGGSAAAIAAGLVGGASGSDGAGSIRIPSACCGIFGLKPQRGRVSLAPYREHWYGMSVAGCVSRTVADTALFLDVTAGPAPGDIEWPPPPDRPFVEAARTPPDRLRIAYSTKPLRAPARVRVSEEVKGAVAQTAELLGSLGHDVARHDPAYGNAGNQLTVRYLKGVEEDVRAVPHPERLERRTRGFARLGSLIPERALRKAREREVADAERINTLFAHHDVLITPVIAVPPVEVGRWEGKGALRTLLGMVAAYPFTGVWNHTGQPAAAVPAGFTDDGLPLSVLLVGRPNDEGTLLSLAGQLESERPWADRRPPVS